MGHKLCFQRFMICIMFIALNADEAQIQKSTLNSSVRSLSVKIQAITDQAIPHPPSPIPNGQAKSSLDLLTTSTLSQTSATFDFFNLFKQKMRTADLQ